MAARLRTSISLAAALLALLPFPASGAEDYPARPIRLIVAAPPGGGTDVMGRILAEKLAPRVKQSVVVENRAGANGFIGINAVAQAKPDGYTLLVTTTGFNVGPLLYKSFTLDPVHELTPVVEILTVPTYLVTNAATPFKSVQEMVAHARANPGRINMGGPVAGRMDTSSLLSSLAIDVNYVAFPGSGGTLTTALIANDVQLVLVSLPVVKGFLADGRLRALAAVSNRRSSVMPDVPSVLEAFPQAQFVTLSNGISGPKGMAREIVDRLNAEFNAILQDPDLRARFASALAAEVRGGTPESWLAVQESSLEQYRRAAQRLKLEPQ